MLPRRRGARQNGPSYGLASHEHIGFDTARTSVEARLRRGRSRSTKWPMMSDMGIGALLAGRGRAR